jgi:hypothetical protein
MGLNTGSKVLHANRFPSLNLLTLVPRWGEVFFKGKKMAQNQQITEGAISYVTNLELARASTTTLTVGAGRARDSNNVTDLILEDDVTINAAVTGLNGLDTGSLANSTWYAVHLIGDSTLKETTGAMLSTSATAPALPFGYDSFRRIGWARTNGSAQLLLFYQSGVSTERTYFWDAVIDSGVSAGSTSFAAVSLAAAAPPSSLTVMLMAGIVPNSAGNALSFRRTGSANASGFINIVGPVASVQSSGQYLVPCNTSQQIDWKTGSASDTALITVCGFVDNL